MYLFSKTKKFYNNSEFITDANFKLSNIIANCLCHCMQTFSANVTLQTILQCDNYLGSNFIYNPRIPEKRCSPEIAVKDRVQADNIIH